MTGVVERRFRVISDAWRANERSVRRIRDGFLMAEPDRSVSVRIDEAMDGPDEDARAAIRIERGAFAPPAHGPAATWRVPLPVGAAREILETLCSGTLVERTRHEVAEQGARLFVDVYRGASEGLVLASAEGHDPGREIPHPEWLGEEVSGDLRFREAHLAAHPYTTWGPAGLAGDEDRLAAAIARSAAAARTSPP